MASEKTGTEQGGSAHVRLRLSSIIAVSFLALAALSIAYISGVMVGRDTCPVPGPAEVRETGTPVDAPEPVEATPEEKKILSAEELEFARVLRGEKARPVKNIFPEKTADGAKQTEAQGDEAQASAANEQSREMSKPEAQESKPEVDKAENGAGAPAIAPGTLFDYVFQVGVFKDENAADNLRQRLEGYGLRTGLERSNKLCVVLVRLRGDEARAAEVANIARELKLGEPVQRSRKAVN